MLHPLEFAAVLTAARNSGPNDHALICLLGMLGLRVSEACAVDIADICYESGYEILHVTGKGGKHADIPLPIPILRAVRATSAAIIKSGDAISDGATVSGLAAGATGSVTFALYGPDDSTCSGTPAFSSTVALTVTPAGNGTATGSGTSASFKPTAAGTYRWIASYSGDGNNGRQRGCVQ